MAIVNKTQNRQLRVPESRAGLRICLLGPVTIEIDGIPVVIASKKARALLGYLVQRSGTDVARSTITGLLWSERGEEQARASLRQTLSELRSALAKSDRQTINASNDSVAWAEGSARIDVKELESKAGSEDHGALREAALLIRGEFMEGLSLDEAAFENWLAGERERFRQLACTVHSRLMNLAERSADIEEALNHGLKLITLDPLQEHVHRALMRLYSAQGRNDAALAQYERCKRELSSQLGVQPEPETESLARSIRTDRRTGPENVQVQAPPARALPDKPSIAVLPFTNLTSDREQEFFADGVAEEIIGALSRVRGLFVTARMSSFVYKGRAVSAEGVARDLSVRYILEGSVRVSGDRVRVNAQLIDGISGGHVWAERYEGDIHEIFAFQDEITRNVALALQVKLNQGESARLWEGQTQNLRAWEKFILARNAFYRFSKIDNGIARKLLEEALRIDPDYTGAIGLLGLTYYWDARFNEAMDRALSLSLAERQAERILKLNPDVSSAYALKSLIAFTRDQFDEAIVLSGKAVELAPTDYKAVGYRGQFYLYAGETEKAAMTIKTAMQLNPHRESWLTYYLTLVYLWAGNFAAALESAELYLQQEPDEPYGLMYLAVVHGFQEQNDKATAIVDQLKERFPSFGIKNVILSERYKEKEKLDRIVNILRAAGLPE
jgi:TolB-like protein/two-component SAPR family response regulator/cytochrome c-type biogenesis protein CcmH/NrfG